jgi:hypothetical protein
MGRTEPRVRFASAGNAASVRICYIEDGRQLLLVTFDLVEAVVVPPEEAEAVRILSLHSVVAVALLETLLPVIRNTHCYGPVGQLFGLGIVFEGAHDGLGVRSHLEEQTHGVLRFVGELGRPRFIHFILYQYNSISGIHNYLVLESTYLPQLTSQSKI